MDLQTPFNQAVQTWIAGRCLNKRQKTADLYRDVERLILVNWPDPDLPAGQITPALVVELGQRFAGQCATRWNLMVACLRSITPHGKVLSRLPVKTREFNPPSQAQFAALLAQVDHNPRTQAGLVIRFLCHTGLRIGEARALQWSHVGTDSITVPGAVTKNGRQRVLPFVSGLGDILNRLRAITGQTGFVLPRESCRKALASASARVLGVKWSVHLCRHFFATRCIQSGVDLPTVARWLGHLDGGALLARTYFHLSDAHSRDMAVRVNVLAGQVNVENRRFWEF